MTNHGAAEIAYAHPVGRKTKKAAKFPGYADFFYRVRTRCSDKNIQEFAIDLLDMDPAHYGRIEAGLRAPGLDTLKAVYPYILQAGMEPRELVYLYLEQHDLAIYVQDLKRKAKTP